MTPGSNIPLPAARVTVDVSAPVRLDVSGLLLTGDGKVRSDDDFIFYNQPSGPGVTYRSGGGAAPDAVTVDTAAVPPDIEKIVVTASPDAAGQTFQGIEPTATIRDADGGAVLATFTPPRPAAAPAAPPQPASPPPAPVPGAGKISLDKGRVSLQKNQTVSLVKGGRPLLSQVRMGLGWEPAFRGKDIDLDASVIAYGPRRELIDSCYFGKLTILNGAIRHSGDNLTGEGGGDDEAITVDLGRLPQEVTGLVFTVNSFSGQKFTEVAKAYCRLVDAATGEELVRFDLTGAEPRTGVLMAKLVRQFSGEWDMTALGDFVKARTVRNMVEPGAKAL
ncbi:TerD family protein [Streptomyces sp. NRRL S-31]|uniref:TerD family protein n=1 Tax=Streptomyces sp. NRRL S-31 TaxID=1463898 RepID=UPI0004C6A9E1|nr:TerD family protein [Streptomyces sp. NRRL S-31]